MGGSTIMEWQEWRSNGNYPKAGGWRDQPLSFLIVSDVLELVYATGKYLSTEGADWANLSKQQANLARWIEASNG